VNQFFSMLGNQIGYQWRLRHFGKQLKLRVDHTAAMKKSDVMLFMCLRNELFRLPFFCDYYRKLGVNHFLIIDNDSTDGIQEWAKSQPDVSLWHTKASYKASNFGMEWCNFLLRKYGTGHLCVTVDPDEFLVYPCMESRNLRELGEYMRMEKREAFHVVMLDAYSDRPLNETIYRSGDNPWDIAPFFDRDGYIQVIHARWPADAGSQSPPARPFAGAQQDPGGLVALEFPLCELDARHQADAAYAGARQVQPDAVGRAVPFQVLRHAQGQGGGGDAPQGAFPGRHRI
jgi:hypothetical protein